MVEDRSTCFLFCRCSLSSGEDHLEKLSEMERILHQAQGEKMRMLEQQVSSSVNTNTMYFALFMNLFSQIAVQPHFCGHPFEGPPIIKYLKFSKTVNDTLFVTPHLRAYLHVPSLCPCPCPSNLHCVNGDGPFDGENGFCT